MGTYYGTINFNALVKNPGSALSRILSQCGFSNSLLETAAAHNQPEPELIAVTHDGLHPFGEILHPLNTPLIQIDIGRAEFLAPHGSFRINIAGKPVSIFCAHKIQKFLNGFACLKFNNLAILFCRTQNSGKILATDLNNRNALNSSRG